MSVTKNREFHIVLFGATGFTDVQAQEEMSLRSIVAKYYLENYGVPSPSLKWAIAGRSKAKLTALVEEYEKTFPGAKNIPILVGDGQDLEFLNALAKRTNVIATTVGPYAKYGSKIVEACANNGTDYIDITAETLWIADMIKAHEAKAKATGARIISACGFDSVPSELGVELIYSEIKRRGLKPKSIKFLIGESAGGVSAGSMLSLFGLMYIHRLHQLTNFYLLLPGMKKHNIRIGEARLVSWDKDLHRWRGPFVLAGINTRVVARASLLLNRDHFYYIEYQSTPPGVLNYFRAWWYWFVTAMMFTLTAIPPIRWLLEAIMRPGNGPTEEVQKQGHCTCYLVGKGIDANGKEHVIKGRVQINGDPGYSQTAKMMGECSVLLATEEVIAKEGGFLTPASGLGPKLIDRLNSKDMPVILDPEEGGEKAAEP